MDFRSVGRTHSALFMSKSRHRSTTAYSLLSITRSLILTPLGSSHFWDNQHPPSIPLSAPRSTGIERFRSCKRTRQRDRPVYAFPLDTSSQGSVSFCICSKHSVFALSSFLSAARTGYSSHDACHIRQILRSSLTRRLFFHHNSADIATTPQPKPSLCCPPA